jgi:hypothetical protein
MNRVKTMKKFIVIYHASASAMEKMQDSSPDDMKKGMEQWMGWAAGCEIEVHESMPMPE